MWSVLLSIIAGLWVLRAIQGISRDYRRQRAKFPAIPGHYAVLGVLMTWGAEGAVIGIIGALLAGLLAHSPLATQLYLAILLASALAIILPSIRLATIRPGSVQPVEGTSQLPLENQDEGTQWVITEARRIRQQGPQAPGEPSPEAQAALAYYRLQQQRREEEANQNPS